MKQKNKTKKTHDDNRSIQVKIMSVVSLEKLDHAGIIEISKDLNIC